MEKPDLPSASNGVAPMAGLPKAIRCSKTSPCTNCISLRITCRAAVRAVEHRPRVLISNYYEKQIEDINHRLSGIERSIRELAVTGLRPPPQRSQSDDFSPPQSDPLLPHDAKLTTPAFLGDSSFEVQTWQVNQVAELSIRGMPRGHSTKVAAALGSLKAFPERDLERSVHRMRLSEKNSLPRPDFESLPLEFVLAVIRKVKVDLPICYLTTGFTACSSLESLAMKVYFPIETPSVGTVTCMYGHIYFIVREYCEPATMHQQGHEFDAWDVKEYVELAKRNLMKGVETYEVLTHPSFENISALTMAACKAQEQSQLPLCWTFCSAAKTLCQNLGWHRECELESDPPDLAEAKRQHFWGIYCLDRNVSLHLGRSSNFQDSDITTAELVVSEDKEARPYEEMANAFIGLARLQGRLYDELYSAGALQKPRAERLRIVEELAVEFEQWRQGVFSVEYKGAKYEEYCVSYIETSNVHYYSMLTLLYRATSLPDRPTSISSHCYAAAKASIQCHLEYYPKLKIEGGVGLLSYIVWVLLYSSFTPFVVVFTHAIMSLSPSDVALLRETVESLEGIREIADEGERVYQVCKVLHQVAKAFVDEGLSLAGQEDKDGDEGLADDNRLVMTENGVYVSGNGNSSQYGFGQEQIQGLNVGDMDVGDLSHFLGGWIGGTQPVIDLMNVDFGEYGFDQG